MHAGGLFYSITEDGAKEMQSRKKTFREFYYETYDALYRYVRRMAGLENMTEDIVQESYCAAYACWDKLAAHPNPVGWLYKTANYIANNIRRRKEHHVVSLEMVRGTERALRVHDAYNMVEFELLLQNLLPQQESDLLYRYYVEGYSGADIAVQLGISEENVRARLSRIRRKLRDKLGEKGTERNNERAGYSGERGVD